MTLLDTRHCISEIPEIAGVVEKLRIEADRREDALFRDCPSAFWLSASDAAAQSAECGTRGAMVATPAADVAEDPGPPVVHGRTAAIATALVTAGPIFMFVLMMTVDITRDSDPTLLFRALAVALVTLPLTAIVGGVLGLAPIVFGTLLLSSLGRRYEVARRRWLWTATGGGVGLAIAAAFDAGAAGGAPLLVTSAVCAMIAHRSIAWSAPPPTPADGIAPAG